MANEILGRLFVSYSHADKAYMMAFRKHLKGMLLNKVEVWSDQDISKGIEWESFLKGNLNQASSAVVLATPDYLVSPWCRQELRQLAAARRGLRLRNVFWVQLKPCGWQHTELAEFQSFESSVERAITELPDDTQRQRAILQSCEQIASHIVRSTTKDDQQLAFVRRLLLDAPGGQDITVSKVVNRGTFSIVCQGLSGSMDVAIKVLRRTPLQRMTEDFLNIGRHRMKLDNPSFVRIHKIFQAGEEEEPRTILVSDFVNDSTLLSGILQPKVLPEQPEVLPEQPEVLPGQVRFDVDKVALLLRRMAEGLALLHRHKGPEGSGPKEQWKWTLGLLTPGDVYYDQSAERLRMPAIGVSSFLWHVLDCATYEDWVDSKARAYVSPEQRNIPGGEHLTPETDQYMLGRLGVELLEGLCLEQILEEKSATVEQFWKDPESLIGGRWRKDHRQLWGVLKRMLATRPAERYDDMNKVVRELQALEEEGRALAKRVFLPSPDSKTDETPQLKGNAKFFKQFYETFFAASPESVAKFKSIDQAEQHHKLMMSMTAVLNFRQGNEPTSLDQFLGVHRGKGITAQEFEEFRKSFLATMDKFSGGHQRQRKAWDDLFAPVVEYMIAKCVEPSGAMPDHGAGIGDANVPGLSGGQTAAPKNTRRRKIRRSQGTGT